MIKPENHEGAGDILSSSVVTIESIREKMKPMVGSRVKLRTNRGRNRIVENEGILDSLYPNIFVIRLRGKQEERYVSYSYSDILTATVELQPCGEDAV